MEGCSKRSTGAASGLPDDVLVEILSRVPAKSVCRFKCVSKAWRDLIADTDNRKKLRHAMQGLFVQTCKVSKVDNVKLARTSFSFIDLTVRSVPLDMDPCFSFLTELTGIKTFFFFDACNGLILFGHLSGEYVVCNPTTRQWSAVPACGSHEAISHAYLAFNPTVSFHFHLLQLQKPDVHEDVVSLHVYSSETGTWSQNQIDKQQEQGQSEGWHHRFTLDTLCCGSFCAFVNGFLHLIVSGSGVQHILVVDVQGKVTRMITLPGMVDGRHKHTFLSYFGQSQGHLHCVTAEYVDKNNDKLSTWVLQDYDTQEWMLKNTVNSLDVFGETGLKPKFQVVDIHHDCNVLFLFHSLSGELIEYNMDRKEASVFATIEDCRSIFFSYIPYFSESPVFTNKHCKCVFYV